jgi:hypothetical protein
MRSKLFVAAGIGLLFLLPNAAFSQSENAPDMNPSRAAAANPHDVTNNSIPTNAGAGMNNPTQWGRANAVYVEHEIAKAKADGKNITVAEAQHRMGMNALNNGMDDEAAQHFDAALRSIGVAPKAQGQNSGETTPGHAAMPGDTHP